MLPRAMTDESAARHGDRADAPESGAVAIERGRYRAGDRVGEKYVLVEPLGEGSMGAVWLARNESLDTDVAIKVVHVAAHSPELQARLEREARAAARLEHPSVVRVFDLGHTALGDPFIVMERLVGRTLRAPLERRDRIADDKAVPLLLPVVSALAAAHAKGIVHRDLKPENVVLVESETGGVVPKVVDFGIAQVASKSLDARRMTRMGTILGSPDYMAPEQAAGDVERIGPAADVWSLGVVLYEMIAGHKPFDGDSHLEQLRAIMQAEHTRLVELGVTDAELSAIVDRALAKEPEDRYADARALGMELAAWALSHGVEADVAGTSTAMHWGHSHHPTLSDFPRPAVSSRASFRSDGSKATPSSVKVSAPAPALASAPMDAPMPPPERASRLPLGPRAVAAIAVVATLLGVVLALTLALVLRGH
jgi:serine/threonine protein kinase